MAEPPPASRTHCAEPAPIRPAPHLAGRGANREVARRLHDAVRIAGGNQAVAVRSGVPLATVNNYVRGRNGMKIEPLAAIATACDVSLEWIVSGNKASATRPLSAEAFPVAAAAPPPGLGEGEATAPLAGRNSGVNMRILAKAIEVVAMIALANLPDDPKELARHIATTYAVLIEPEASRD